MGCLNNFVSVEQLMNSGELRLADIIEFSRVTYSHFGLYIGNGICVHVLGPNKESSSQSISVCKSPNGTRQAQTIVEIAGNYGKVRVNNCILIASTKLLSTRGTQSAVIEKAIEGLPRDSNGKVMLNTPVDYNYNLMWNNCEYFVTRCRYKHDEGFSIQADNGLFSSTLGTVERATSALRDDCAGLMSDPNKDPIEKGVAAVVYGTSTGLQLLNSYD